MSSSRRSLLLQLEGRSKNRSRSVAHTGRGQHARPMAGRPRAWPWPPRTRCQKGSPHAPTARSRPPPAPPAPARRPAWDRPGSRFPPLPPLASPYPAQTRPPPRPRLYPTLSHALARAPARPPGRGCAEGQRGTPHAPAGLGPAREGALDCGQRALNEWQGRAARAGRSRCSWRACWEAAEDGQAGGARALPRRGGSRGGGGASRPGGREVGFPLPPSAPGSALFLPITPSFLHPFHSHQCFHLAFPLLNRTPSALHRTPRLSSFAPLSTTPGPLSAEVLPLPRPF